MTWLVLVERSWSWSLAEAPLVVGRPTGYLSLYERLINRDEQLVGNCNFVCISKLVFSQANNLVAVAVAVAVVEREWP